MDLRRRPPRPSSFSPPSQRATPISASASAPASAPAVNKQQQQQRVQASDALPLPIRHTNKLFSALFMASLYFLMSRWREKIRSTTPLHLLTLSEILAVSAFVSSLVYLISFFGIAYVQSFISDSNHDEEDDQIINGDRAQQPICPLLATAAPAANSGDLPLDDQEIVQSVVAGVTPSYILESKLNDTHRAAKLRRESLKLITGRSIDGLPLDGFDYDSILGQCCEMPVGFVQLPVGIAGPLVLDSRVYYVPMATTEGCLVASTNRGCKAIAESGGAMSVVLRDGMTRAPAVRFGTAKRSAELKLFLEESANFETLALIFNR